jgi:hypothetical protein
MAGQFNAMPWKYDIKSLPVPVGSFLKPNTQAKLMKMVPFWLNDLDWIGNPTMVERIVKGIIDAVRQGEEWFNQGFGGWTPDSNEFGIQTLRPLHLGRPDNRWIWTDGASSTIFWSADDAFITSHTMDTDELILIYGYFNLEPVPNTLELFIQPGAAKMPICNIETMRISGKKYTLFPDPFIIPPRASLAIAASVRSLTTATKEEAGLLGYMFAPNSRLLRKDT